MSRLTYAAEQLIAQVQAHKPDAEITYGEPDGIDVIRDITFDPTTSKWLWPLMKDELDERLSSGILNKRQLTLTFQGRSSLADDRRPFDLPKPSED